MWTLPCKIQFAASAPDLLSLSSNAAFDSLSHSPVRTHLTSILHQSLQWWRGEVGVTAPICCLKRSVIRSIWGAESKNINVFQIGSKFEGYGIATLYIASSYFLMGEPWRWLPHREAAWIIMSRGHVIAPKLELIGQKMQFFIQHPRPQISKICSSILGNFKKMFFVLCMFV